MEVALGHISNLITRIWCKLLWVFCFLIPFFLLDLFFMWLMESLRWYGLCIIMGKRRETELISQRLKLFGCLFYSTISSFLNMGYSNKTNTHFLLLGI